MTSPSRPKPETNQPATTASADETTQLSQRHFRWGWWCLLLFVGLGVVLETLHAFKVGSYLNVGNETRRLMWTLAHAHGTLLALVHMAFGATVALSARPQSQRRFWASRCLTYSALLIPLGFFLGGLDVHGGDPSLGILLVPIGAALLLVAIALTAGSLHS